MENLQKKQIRTYVFACIVFVPMFALCNWHGFLSFASMAFGKADFAIAMCLATAVGVVIAAVLPQAAKALSARFNLPQTEISLFALLFCTLYNLLLGLLSLAYVISSLTIAWGRRLFLLVASAIAMWCFYVVTARRYIDELTLPKYFKTLCVCYVFVLLVLEVLA